MKFNKSELVVAINGDDNSIEKFTCPRNNMCKHKLKQYIYQELNKGKVTTVWTFSKG
ncbi:hypothetical protein NVP1084O_036 [Vibrio phage 1.084.O._10N.261.49.F5]|nr:hypothetical protein NVP1084O_036 [Vibrio phage 1.084.O._10N.261.49.F5]